MKRILFLFVLLVACSTVLTGCGVVSHQLHRAANLLRVPVRVTQVETVLPVFGVHRSLSSAGLAQG